MPALAAVFVLMPPFYHLFKHALTDTGITRTIVYVGDREEINSLTGVPTPLTATTNYYYAGALRVALSVTTTKYITDPRTGKTYPQVTGGGITLLASDKLGSANVALDQSTGNVVAQTLYAPYGTALYSNGTMPGSYGFTGQHSDGALDYYGARYYDPVAGQFASADTTHPRRDESAQPLCLRA